MTTSQATLPASGSRNASGALGLLFCLLATHANATDLVSSSWLPDEGGDAQCYPTPSVSSDGNRVAFASKAANLVTSNLSVNDLSIDIFVRDLALGSTVQVSLPADGSTYTNNDSTAPSLSANGRFVAFTSRASNLLPGDLPRQYSDIYVLDLQNGVTTRITEGLGGGVPDHPSSQADVSADGRYVVFQSEASNLVANDVNPHNLYGRDIFLHDRLTAATILVSAGPLGESANGNSSSPSISADGRFVVFLSRAGNLAADPNLTGGDDIFVRDLQSGITERISVALDDMLGANQSCLDQPAISDDGRFVAFTCFASNLVANDFNGNAADIFVRDRLGGTTTLISTGLPAGVGANSDVNTPSISADGRYVAFHGPASNLVAGDANGQISDVFVHDRQTGITRLASNAADGSAGNASSSNASLSADGRYVTYVATASNLVASDPNGGVRDVFRSTASDSIFADGFE